MTRISKISAPQLFCLLLLSRGVLSVAYGAFSSSKSIQSAAIAAVLSGIISVLLSIPVLFLGSGGEKALKSGAGRVISGFYALYFFYVICVTLTLFTVLRAETSGLRISIFVLPLLILITALYGSYKGIEAIARTGSLILFAVITAFVLLCLSLISRSDVLNLAPIGSLKLSDITSDTIIMLGEQNCIPAIVFIYPHVKGKVKSTIILWILVLFACIASLSLFIASVLGNYSDSQLFPVYAWARLSSFGVLQRLDALFLAIWTAGVFARLALLFWVLATAVKYAVGKKTAKFAPVILGAVALLVAVNAAFDNNLREIILNSGLLLSTTVVCSVILPVMLIIKSRFGRRVKAQPQLK